MKRVLLAGMLCIINASIIGANQLESRVVDAALKYRDRASDKSYFNGSYPSTHWALQKYTIDDIKESRVITFTKFKSSEYVAYMNPTDKRGYRLIVSLIDNNMGSTLNRDYTTEERIGLGLSVALMTDLYSKLVPIAQNAIAGNNSHEFKNDIVEIGIAAEPAFLHGHVWGRGNPKSTYIAGVELDGPVPGKNFDMMAKTKEEGNDKKVAWKKGDMEKVTQSLRDYLINKMDISDYRNQGLNVR